MKLHKATILQIASRLPLLPTAVMLLAPIAAYCQEFAKVPETSVLKKVVAASDSVYATTSREGDGNAFRLDILNHYLVLAEGEDFVKITDKQDGSGRIGFVQRRQVIEWNTREGLHFQSSILSHERPEVKIWKDRETIEKFAATGDLKAHGPSYAEEKAISRALPRELVPYPILESAMVSTLTGTDKRIYRALFPAYVPAATVEMDLTDDEIRAVLSGVTFCIVFDATASMEPYAFEVAATIESLLRGLGAEAKSEVAGGDSEVADPQSGVRVGFVFFRDTGDNNPVEIFDPAPLDVAVKRLREMAKRMTGGGDAAEPVLDAAVIAASEFDWASGEQTGHRRAAIIVLNDDAKPETVGLGGEDRVGPGQNAGDVAHLLATKFIRVFALQAGSKDGGNLKSTLGRLSDGTGGVFYAHDMEVNHSFSSNIKELLVATAAAARKEARTVADATIPGDRDFTVVPLRVLDSKLISRLQEAASEFNLTGDGLMIREGWMFEQADIHEEQILVEKEIVEQLIVFFNLLTDSSIPCEDLRSGVRENLKAMLGEDIDDRAELQDLLEKKLGIHFRTTLLGFSLEYLCGLSPREKLQLQKRIAEAKGKLSSFLEVATTDFDKGSMAWMGIAYLP